MKKLFKAFILVVALAALFFFQQKGVMPVVYKVISSKLFLEDSDNLGDPNTISNSMTKFANQHCNEHIRLEYGDNLSLTLPEQALKTWDIGNYDYLVNGEVTVQPEQGPSFIQKYVCRIKHVGEQPENIDSWSLYDISGLDNL